MMKKNILAFICLLIICVPALSSCSQNVAGDTASPDRSKAVLTPIPSPAQTSDHAEDPGTVPQPSSEQSSAPEPNKDTTSLEYRVTSVTKAKFEEAKAIYPQVDGLDNPQVQQKINDTLLRDAESALQDIQDGDHYESDFTVTHQGEDILCILIKGGVYHQGSAHPYAFASAYNFDLSTGEDKSLISDEDKQPVGEAISKGDFTVLDASDDVRPYIEEYFTQVLDEEMIRSSVDSLTDMSYAGRTCLIGDKLCIIMDVNHALGDYCILQMNNIRQ